nr:MAG TPA: hypothetical protein [Caudoviricetes sp.]
MKSIISNTSSNLKFSFAIHFSKFLFFSFIHIFLSISGYIDKEAVDSQILI